MPWNTPEELGERVCLTIPIARWLVPPVLSVLADMSKLAGWKQFGAATKDACTQEAMEALIASRWEISGEEGCFPPDPDPCPECPDCPDPPIVELGCCTEYYPGHPAIKFEPSDPFTEPDAIPDFYFRHPWITGQNSVIPDMRDRDTIATWYSLAPNPPTGNINDLIDWLKDILSNIYDDLLENILDPIGMLAIFPRFKFKFNGTSRLYLHLIKVPLGGTCLIRVDGEIIPKAWVLSMDSNSIFVPTGLFSVLNLIFNVTMIGLFFEDIVELNVDGAGEHEIEVLFVPRIEKVGEVLGQSIYGAIGWGGGVRKIVSCCKPLIAPDPPKPAVRVGETCIEWLNPATAKWECLMPIEGNTELIERVERYSDSGCCDECDDGGCADECSDCDECEECD